MMRSVQAILGLLVLATLSTALSGCTSTTNYCLRPNLSAREVAPSVTTTNGTGDVVATVHVTDASSGQSLAGALVRTYWPIQFTEKGSTRTSWFVFAVTIEKNTPGSAATLMYLDAKTDATGNAVFHVPAGAHLTAVAAAKEHTQESTSQNLGPDAMTIQVPLFRNQVTVSQSQEWHDASVTGSYLGTNSDDIHWLPAPMPWSSSPSTSSNYTARLVGITARLTWDNSVPSRSDMGIGLGLDPTAYPLVARDATDEMKTLDPGTEEFTLALGDLEELHVVGHGDVYAGPFYRAMAAPLGMTTNMTLIGTFDTEKLMSKYCHDEFAGVHEILRGDRDPIRHDSPPSPSTHAAGQGAPAGSSAAGPSSSGKAASMPSLAVIALSLGAAVVATAARRR